VLVLKGFPPVSARRWRYRPLARLYQPVFKQCFRADTHRSYDNLLLCCVSRGSENVVSVRNMCMPHIVL